MTDHCAFREPGRATRVENDEGILRIDRLVGLHWRQRLPRVDERSAQHLSPAVPTLEGTQYVPKAL
jgi:hypothetical protein